MPLPSDIIGTFTSIKRILAIALLGTLSATAQQALRSGRASGQWLVPGGVAEAGGSLKTVARLKVDDHWHVYWSNPGKDCRKLLLAGGP